MARTWAILGRVLHVPLLVPGDAPAGGKGEAEAEAERDAEAHGMAEVKAADAQAGGGLETLDKAATQQGADFSILLAEPPRITVMTVAPTAHLIHEYPDSHAYIVSVDSDCILLNFGVDPFKVAGFDDRPYQSNLIVVRDYNWAGVGQGHPITATAERIPPRSGGQPAVTNVESIGLIYSLDPEDYVIAELMIDKGCERAMFLYSYAGIRDWIQETTDNPLPLPERDREWIPSGVVSYKKMLWWFDLSWGIISSGPMLETAEPLLLFHRLPEGHDLNQAQRGMHDRRCIAVSRGCLRYVAITTDGDAATVSMWTRVPSALVNDGTVGWIWEKEFTVSFAEIWGHDCYAATRLPRKVPVLAAVSPSNANIVYFALADQKKRLFGVNMYSRAVEEFIDESYELLMPGRPDAPPSCRYVLPWFLPLEPRAGSNSRDRLPRQSAAAAARNAMSGGGQDLQLPPGFRFHPTDEELVVHYLCRRCAGLPIAVSIIAEIDLYKFDPWQLPRMALYGEKEWYFFSPRDRKYPNGSRPNRAAGSGYWKATGSDKPVGAPKPLAIKKALVFYAGKAPKGEKTNWIMHEYRLADVDRSARKNSKKNRLRRLDDWVLCRIYNKKGELEKPPVAGKPELAAAVSSPPEQKPFVALPAPGPGGLLPAFVPGLEAYYDRPSDSMPRLHADSSCSEQQALSPEQQQQLACDREVQSQPKISEWERTFASDPAGSLLDPVGDPLLQDILMYWDKPF